MFLRKNSIFTDLKIVKFPELSTDGDNDYFSSAVKTPLLAIKKTLGNKFKVLRN
jgi:hypothetical protein